MGSFSAAVVDVANVTTSGPSSASDPSSASSAASSVTAAHTVTPDWYVPLSVGLRLNNGGNKELSLQPQVCYSFDNCDFNDKVFSVVTGGIISSADAVLNPYTTAGCEGSPASSEAKGRQATSTDFSGNAQFSILVYEDLTGITQTDGRRVLVVSSRRLK